MTADAYTVCAATWPAATTQIAGGCTIRNGAGGGSRVSSATCDGPLDLPAAEAAMRALTQTPQFMIRDGEDALDATLANAGYVIKDPVNIYACDIAQLAASPPPVTCFTVWPPLAAQVDIWAQGGIDAPRLAVMDRCTAIKASFLGRINDRPAATGFAAIHDQTCMLHALEVIARDRRQGLARAMIPAIARWGQKNGATQFSLVVTQANLGANALYASLGMRVVGHYHYRIKQDAS